jgi:hypothetical protein
MNGQEQQLISEAAARIANREEPRPQARKRIPMSTRRRILELTEELPGYVPYWFVDTPGRIAAAIQASYEFVDAKEVNLYNMGVGTNSDISGNMDLGSRVTIIGKSGTRHVLMKIRKELWLEDQKEINDENAKVISAVFRGAMIYGDNEQGADSDISNRYVKTAKLLNRPFRRKTTV